MYKGSWLFGEEFWYGCFGETVVVGRKWLSITDVIDFDLVFIKGGVFIEFGIRVYLFGLFWCCFFVWLVVGVLRCWLVVFLRSGCEAIVVFGLFCRIGWCRRSVFFFAIGVEFGGLGVFFFLGGIWVFVFYLEVL